jgi:putative membrane protein
MKLLVAAALAASTALVAACATPMADTAEAAMDPMNPLSAPGYMRMAASSDMFEIESSRLALQMSRNPAVRSFAQMMIDDHTRTSGEMMGLAQQLRLSPPPPEMAPHHAEMLGRLGTASPMDFDRAYKAEQIAAHQEALTLHRNYADQGDLPPLREFAGRTAPVVEMHYGHAQSLPDYAAAPQPAPYQPEPAPPVRRRSGERG